MNELINQKVDCPYCGEWIEVLIDGSEEEQRYVEDCQVCCCPIIFNVTSAMNGEVSVWLQREDE